MEQEGACSPLGASAGAPRPGDSRDRGDVVDSGHSLKVEGRTSSQIDQEMPAKQGRQERPRCPPEAASMATLQRQFAPREPGRGRIQSPNGNLFSFLISQNKTTQPVSREILLESQ